jgi:hypothetical protein
MSTAVTAKELAPPVARATAPPMEAYAAAATETKRAYPAAAPTPTQRGAHGIRFDFNDGCRLVLPEGRWHVRLSDRDTGNILYETDIGAGHINSTKRYYLRCLIEVWAAGQAGEVAFRHEYLAGDQEVLVQFPIGTLRDTLGWFPYAVKFQEQHGCRLSCAMAERLIPLFRDVYPQIRFLTHEEVEPETYYATYNLGLFFDDGARVHQPCDFRLVGLHRTAGYILGVDPTEVAPQIALPDERVRFDHKDFLWCPRHANTPRQFECTRLITAEAIKTVIRRIPGFAKQVLPAPVLVHARAARAKD